MTSNQTVTVYGAYGHTGRFVVSELRRRGWTPILSGRDSDKLNAIGAAHSGLEIRPASVDDPASLDRALVGATAVINCAGPFARTSAPVIEAALRARIPYLDVAAEIEANADTFDQYATRAREAGIVIVPAMAFYGGLGDLLATAAMADWSEADEICIAYGLSSWKPTLGTRAASQVSRQRRNGRRIVFSKGRMEFRTDDAPITEWTFPAPIGTQSVVAEFTMADTLTISRHLRTPEIRSFMTLAAVKDLSDPDLSPPPAIDESGRSSQTFLVEVVARRASAERRASASGRDIYAITAPLVVEATERVVNSLAEKAGVFAAGEVFDAQDFLRSLCPEYLSFEIQL
jgi:saccharopine dehydrogenase-like NADP-dependent oxidoreductase